MLILQEHKIKCQADKMKKHTLNKFLEEFSSDDVCLEWLKNYKYPNGIRCRNKKCKKYGKVTPHHRIRNAKCYSCGYCGNHIHPMANTILKKTTTPLKYWFYAVYIMSKTRCGISAKQLQRELGVTYKTAWRIFHKIREMLYQKPQKKNGTVEVDETYVGGKRRGKRGRGSENKTAVFGIVERKGKLVAQKIANVRSNTLIPLIKENVTPHAIIYTDEYPSYNPLDRLGYMHDIINHAKKVYVINDVHINNIEGFWSLFKRGINGVYHSVSKKHLQNYINEYVFRYNNRNNENAMFHLMMASVLRTS